MPKTYLTREMRLREKLTTWIYGQMKVNKMSQQQVAKSLGLSQAGLSLKLKKQSLTFDDFIFFLNLFKPDTDEIMDLVGAEWNE